MLTIFKQIAKLYKTITYEQDKVAEDSDRGKELQIAKDLLEEVIEYVDSFDWLKKDKSKEKVQFFLESGEDYDLLCKQYDISKDTAYNTIRWASKQLRDKIGENTVSLIKDGHIEEARAAFYSGIGRLGIEKFVVSDLLEHLPEAKYTTYYLEECKTELTILRNFSLSILKNYLKAMDTKKMAYILFLLEGKSKKSDLYRPYLIQLLEGKIKVDDLIEIGEEIQEELK